MLIPIVALLLAQEPAAPNKLTRAEKSAGWQLLFDGKSMKGWEAYRTTGSTTGDWKIDKGAIVCGGGGAGWLATNGAYRDFQLELDFLPQEKTNSGVFLRSQKQGEPHVTGYELQIWDFQPAGFLTGSLVGSAKADPVRLKAGVWNHYSVEAQGDHFVVNLNGAKVLDVHDAKHREGSIGLQCQKDNPIQFRNIKMRPNKSGS